jgi:hypothetical protein
MKNFKFQNNSFSGTDMIAQAYMSYIQEGKMLSKTYTLGSIQTITYSIHMDRKPIRAIGNINARDYVMGPRTIAGTLMFAVFNKHFSYEMMDSVQDSSRPTNKFLADEMPPFDIVISFANEYGTKSKMVLYGVKLINEGQVMSINDIYTENTYQFVALDIDYMDEESDSAGSGNTGKTIVKSNTGKIIDDSANPSTDIAAAPKNTNIVLAAQQTLLPKTKGGKGTVKLTVSPDQSTGSITITNTGNQGAISLSVSDSNGQTLYANLVPGKYVATYINEEGKTSNTAGFVMADYTTDTDFNTKPPIITAKTNTSILVTASSIGHSKVKYAEANITGGALDYKELPLKGISANITGLKSNTSYYICTANALDTSISKLVQCTTYTSNEEPYNTLIAYMTSNKNRLSYPINDYKSLISAVASWAGQQGYSITEAFMEYKSNIQKDIKSLDPTSFSDIDKYNEELQDLNKELSICQTALTISIDIMNDKVYAFNTDSTLKAPRAQMAYMLNAALLLDIKTKTLEVYKTVGNTEVFDKSIPSTNFLKYTNGDYYYKFTGRTGFKYKVFSVDAAGNKSTPFEFYMYEDNERSTKMQAYTESAEVYASKYNAVKALKEDELSTKVSSANVERLIIENLMKLDTPLVKTPWVISADNKHVTVGIDNRDIVGNFDTDFYVAISTVEDTGKDKTYYKIGAKLIPVDLNDVAEVTFTSEDHGLRENNVYAIWIEDDNQNQISNIVTTRLDIEENDLEDEVRAYVIKQKIDSIKKSLISKLGKVQEVISCVDNLLSDTSLNESNIFEALIYNIISIKPQLSNLDTVIRYVFEIKTDIERFANISFFDKNPVFNINSNNITFKGNSYEYMLAVQHINKINSLTTTDIIHVSENTDQVITLNDPSEFVILTATDKNLYNKSGMLFVDTSRHSAIGYKMNIEVIR